MAKFLIVSVLCALLSVALTQVINVYDCPENELYALTTPLCGVTCQNRNKFHCLGLINAPSCQCAPGYLRDTNTKKCVRREDCPPVADLYSNPDVITPEDKENIRASCDPATEIFSETTPVCQPKCHNGIQSLKTCMSILMRPSCLCRATLPEVSSYFTSSQRKIDNHHI
ncbi:hypothetical protein BLOT_009370 [Blomia tropicalis]|nr:hypothetical protein BLOT_009370 [Blomia tropicalis]